MNHSIVQSKNFNRWIPVISSFTIQLCFGTAYIWSVFQSYMIISDTTPNALFHWPATYGTLAYALLLGLLAVGSTIGGMMHKRFNPRTIIMISGLILATGFCLVKFTTEGNPWLLWFSYGILGGIGMGMAYTTTISCCQKWFPDKKGLVTGLIVSALGFGGLIFAPLAEKLIVQYGLLNTFAIFGILFLIITLFGSFFIINPPEGYIPEGWSSSESKSGVLLQSFTPLEAFKTPQFYMVILAFMCATAAGSMMIPMAKILGLQADSGLTEEAAIAGVMLVSAFNSFGRLFWGWVSDKLGGRKTLLILLVITGVSIILVSFVKAYLMLVIIGIIGFSYGGFLGVFPSLSADYWGTKNIATIYGLILGGFGIGAVVSSYTVAYFSATKDFSKAFIIAAIAALIGFVIISFLKSPQLKAKEE